MSKGKITLVTGCMFAGKTTYLINHAKKIESLGQSIVVYHPENDIRYAKNAISSHDETFFDSIALSVTDPEINTMVSHIVIDEVQFFDPKIVSYMQDARENGSEITTSGLNFDFRGEKFPVTAAIAEIADSIVELKAICAVCGKPATKSQRKNATVGDPTVVIGGEERYEARCEICFVKP